MDTGLYILVSEPNPLRPLRDLQYGLGETVFGGCRHVEYTNILGFNEPKSYFVCFRQEAQIGFYNVFLLRFLRKVVLDIRNHSLYIFIVLFLINNSLVLVLLKKNLIFIFFDLK